VVVVDLCRASLPIWWLVPPRSPAQHLTRRSCLLTKHAPNLDFEKKTNGNFFFFFAANLNSTISVDPRVVRPHLLLAPSPLLPLPTSGPGANLEALLNSQRMLLHCLNNASNNISSSSSYGGKQNYCVLL
jgi:hypothetical protein